ncbi:hypothetical protein DFH09DRAFT_438413 [Mycena vulgaris]|nr:hypothetical protein DFH09DRAFT_438413 [Mycena vulgaris]
MPPVSVPGLTHTMVNASFSTLFVLALAAVTAAVPIVDGDNKTWVVGRAAPTPIARAEAYSGPHPAPRDVEPRCVGPPPKCIPPLSNELVVRLEEPCVGGPPGCLPPRAGCTGGPNGDACIVHGRGEKRA